MIKYFLSVAVICLVSLPSWAKDQTFEAQIRHPNGNQAKVRIEARDHHDAKTQMIARYCAGDDRCLLEGPWLYHGAR